MGMGGVRSVSQILVQSSAGWQSLRGAQQSNTQIRTQKNKKRKIKNQTGSPSGAPNNPTQGDLGKLNFVDFHQYIKILKTIKS